MLAAVLTATWWARDWLQTGARVAAIVIACLLVITVAVAVRSRRLVDWTFGAAGWLFLSKQATVDWRTLGRSLVVITGVCAVAIAPTWVWGLLLTAAAGLLAGSVAVAQSWRVPHGHPAQILSRLPAPRTMSREARQFRRRYPEIARELGWDKSRRNADDRQAIPKLVSVDLTAGVWTMTFISRGDWDRTDWETQAHAMRRHLSGTFVHATHDAPRVTLSIMTMPLPAMGDHVITAVQPITTDGILLGHDAAGREVRWAADHRSPHGVVSGATGAGKSFLAALALLQAAATEGWQAVMLDAKETHDWDWMRAHGIRVIREEKKIRSFLGWLEKERKRIEDTGEKEVTRLVVLDEARRIVGVRRGPKKTTNEISAEVVNDLTSLGRSAGIRLWVMTQRPDVDEIGGGFLRNNLTLRVAMGRMGSSGRLMLFDDRLVSDQELEVLDGTAGRAIASGLRGGDVDGTAFQVPMLRITGMGSTPPDAQHDREPDPRQQEDVPAPAGRSDDDPDLMLAAIAAAVPAEGCTRRHLAQAVGLTQTSRAFRDRFELLHRAGVVVWAPGGPGRPGLVSRGEAWQGSGQEGGREVVAGRTGPKGPGGSATPSPGPTSPTDGPDPLAAAA